MNRSQQQINEQIQTFEQVVSNLNNVMEEYESIKHNKGLIHHDHTR